MSFAFTSGDIWPLTGTKPSIEGIFVANVNVAILGDFGLLYPFIEYPVAWVVNILEGRNWDAPRDLARDIPIFELL